MKPIFVDPDMKINMSLDEIIRLTQERRGGQAQGRAAWGVRKKAKKRARKVGSAAWREHSVPLLSSTQGVGIHVSKNSPLLSLENRRRITQMMNSRLLNADLLEKSKKIIPAEYKLIKTNQGVERVLVPAAGHFPSQAKMLKPPRKLKEETCSASTSAQKPDHPPPLVTATIYQPPTEQRPPTNQQPPNSTTAMEVDDSDDDIVVLSPTALRQDSVEVIDVEWNMPVDVLESKKLFLGESALVQNGGQSLNDRFTMLTGHFTF